MRNLENQRKWHRKYYQLHKEELRESRRDYQREYQNKYRKGRLEYQREYNRKYREEHRPYFNNYKKHHRKEENARRDVFRAVKSGKLTKRALCEICMVTNTFGHHHDYDKPLEVIWLCRQCHLLLHRKLFIRNQS